MESLISNEKRCFVCGATEPLHKHHIFYGNANRRLSDEDGCWVWLCARHHNMSNEGVHFNKPLDLTLRKKCEKAWLEYYDKDILDFIARYGRNYI